MSYPLRLSVAFFILAAATSRFELWTISCTLVACITAVLARPRLPSRVVTWAVCFLTYWFVSGLVAQTVPWSESFSIWAQGTGRTAIALLPALLLSGIQVGEADLAWFRRFLFSTVTALAVLAVAALAGIDPLTTISGGLFFGLSSSHHGAGLLASVSLLLAIFSRQDRWGLTGLEIAAGAIVLLASGSRTSLVALILTLAVYWTIRASTTQRLVAFVAIPATVLVLFSTTPRLQESADLMSRDRIATALYMYEYGQRASSVKQLSTVGFSDVQAVANVETRYALFGRAVSLWKTSPWLGVGAGRFDASQSENSGLRGVVYLSIAAGPSAAPNVAGDAHNSYLHLLAETGLVGLLLMTAVFAAVWRRRPSRLRPKDLWELPKVITCFILFSGLTGATWMSPALMFVALPVALVFSRDPTGEVSIRRQQSPVRSRRSQFL